VQAGWKLWPFAHLVTYGLVPVEQRLLWVDCVEIVWVTILSMFANKKAEQRLEAVQEASVATDVLLLSEGDDMVASKES
jgi:protein Mpv17